jgi:hypothetical protein
MHRRQEPLRLLLRRRWMTWLRQGWLQRVSVLPLMSFGFWALVHRLGFWMAQLVQRQMWRLGFWMAQLVQSQRQD